MMNDGGTITSIHLSSTLDIFLNFRVVSSWVWFVSTVTLLGLLYLLYPSRRVYSKIANMMNSRQERIHCVMALAFGGNFSAVELKMLTLQSMRVMRNPILPGIDSTGSRKLI